MPLDPTALSLLAGLAVITVIGFFKVRRVFHDLNEKREEADLFLKLLERYRASGGADSDAYTKLTCMSPRIQANLGALGMITYKPPGAQFMIKNYQVVVNELPELKRWLATDDLFSTIKPGQQSADLIRDTIVRYVGVLDERRVQRQSQLRNPFSLLAEGMRWCLSLPLHLLASLGVLSSSSARRAEASRPLRLTSGLIALVSLISSVVGIVSGWAPFIAIIRKLLGR